MKKQKLMNSIKSGILIFGIILFFTNCEANKDIIEESELEHHTPPVLSEKISFTQSKHFNEINSEIKSIQTKFNKKQTSKENQSETGSFKILTDEVLYVTYAGTHTYTFKVVRKNPIYLLENIVLHYNLRTKSYDEYLMQYKDIKEQDIKAISEGKLFQDSKKVIVTKLENGFFESHSSSNKSSSTSKASSVICNTVTSTVFVSCGSGDHHSGNLGSWGECKLLSSLPYAYQSSSTTCVATTATTPIPQETANPSSGGGGNDPYVVIYNPLPLETCDNSDEVDLNGNCIQPIDIAVSYIANCLSSNYATILSQSDINFLYSTTSSFEIKSYLENNGRSSESSSFVKEMVNYMRQNTDVTWEKIENWFMGSSEGQDGEYDAAFWENPNLTFQQQNLPSLANFKNACPSKYTDAVTLCNTLGGDVLKMYNDVIAKGKKLNTCAIRISTALIKCDISIPFIPDNPNGSKNTVKDKNGNYLIINAKVLNEWMRKTFGTNPANYRHFTAVQGGVNGVNFPKLMEDIESDGIYSMVSRPEIQKNWGTGHADILEDGDCRIKCHFYDDTNNFVPVDYIDVWILK